MTPEKLLKALETAEAGDRELDAGVAEVARKPWLKFTLAPELAVEAIPGHWEIANPYAVGKDGRYSCLLTLDAEHPRYLQGMGETEVTGTGNTPALAICAAAVIAGMVDNVVRGRGLGELGELANKELE